MDRPIQVLKTELSTLNEKYMKLMSEADALIVFYEEKIELERAEKLHLMDKLDEAEGKLKHLDDKLSELIKDLRTVDVTKE